MATIVYFLCFATSLACALLLVRSYMKTSAALLLWTAICFVFLAINNLFVVLDLSLLPDIDLQLARDASNLMGLATLLYGFIWELD